MGSGGNGIDSYGFSALPGGLLDNGGAFGNAGSYGYWWSSTEFDATLAWSRRMYSDYGSVFRYNFNKRLGFSVRCVRD